MLKTTLEIEISEIEVDTRNFSFSYKITKDGEVYKESSYSSDHGWNDDFEGFTKILKEGYAVELAIDQLS